MYEQALERRMSPRCTAWGGWDSLALRSTLVKGENVWCEALCTGVGGRASDVDWHILDPHGASLKTDFINAEETKEQQKATAP